jgi:hypothetical protein
VRLVVLVAVAVAVVVEGGCATARLPPCPARGGAAWSRVASRHFVVRTDLDVASAEELVRELEEARAAILALAWPKAADPPGRVDVVAFRSREELGAVAPEGVTGMWRKRPPFPPMLVLGGVSRLDSDAAVAHEVTHDLAHRFLPIQPPWYSEGVATYFETLTYDRTTGVARVGPPPLARLHELHSGGRWVPEELVRCRRAPGEGPALGRFESSSWLLFHYLVDIHPAELERFQELVRELAPWEEAWTRAFHASYAQLKDELGAYLADDRFKVGERRVKVEVGMIETRAMRDAEVHVVRSLLLTGKTETSARARRAELADALAQEPADVEALAAEAYLLAGDDKEAVTRARRAVALRPTSALAAAMFADAVGVGDPEAHGVLIRALAAAPSDAEIMSRLAKLAAARGRWDESLALSTRAIRLGAVDDVSILVVLAKGLAHLGRCGEATFVMRALSWTLAPKDVADLALSRSELEDLCRRPSPAAPAP